MDTDTTTIKIDEYTVRVKEGEDLIEVLRPGGSQLLMMNRHHTIDHVAEFIQDDQRRLGLAEEKEK